MEQTNTLITILTVIGGIIVILRYLRDWAKDGKDNAVETANLKKDVEALKSETRREIGHFQIAIDKIDEKTDKMYEKQSEMQGDIKSIIQLIKK